MPRVKVRKVPKFDLEPFSPYHGKLTVREARKDAEDLWERTRIIRVITEQEPGRWWNVYLNSGPWLGPVEAGSELLAQKTAAARWPWADFRIEFFYEKEQPDEKFVWIKGRRFRRV